MSRIDSQGYSIEPKRLVPSAVGENVITAATNLALLAPQGGTFGINLSAAFAITIPTASIRNAGVRYVFYIKVIAPVAQTATITLAAGQFLGTITNGTPAIAPVIANDTVITFTATAVLGDCAILESTGAAWLVTATTSAAAGITSA